MNRMNTYTAKRAAKKAAQTASLTIALLYVLGLMIWGLSVLFAVIGYNLLVAHVFHAPVIDPVGYLGLLLFSLSGLMPFGLLKNGGKA